jgi:hypothetical protein
MTGRYYLIVPRYLHRWLLDAPPGVLVDHRNGDSLDNRRSTNLRLATNQENQRNQVRVRGRSRYKGVAWNCRRRQWQAKISVDGRDVHLGWFRADAEAEAARAYNQAAQRYFGLFARLNENPSASYPLEAMRLPVAA